jgi:hypothetical protein
VVIRSDGRSQNRGFRESCWSLIHFMREANHLDDVVLG